jgi:hypothetical protein
MGLIDSLLLTLVSTILCLGLPKILSVILAPKAQGLEALPSGVPVETGISEVKYI